MTFGKVWNFLFILPTLFFIIIILICKRASCSAHSWVWDPDCASCLRLRASHKTLTSSRSTRTQSRSCERLKSRSHNAPKKQTRFVLLSTYPAQPDCRSFQLKTPLHFWTIWKKIICYYILLWFFVLWTINKLRILFLRILVRN